MFQAVSSPERLGKSMLRAQALEPDRPDFTSQHTIRGKF